MRDELTTAFIVFAMIDLTLVGTTCIAVILLVRKVMLGRVEIKIAGKTKRLDRDFVELGNQTVVAYGNKDTQTLSGGNNG
jgi:hypothetical protein